MSYEAEARAMYERHARHYPDEPWVPGPWRMAPATPGQLSYLHKIAKRRALTGCTAEELALVQRIAAERIPLKGAVMDVLAAVTAEWKATKEPAAAPAPTTAPLPTTAPPPIAAAGLSHSFLAVGNPSARLDAVVEVLKADERRLDLIATLLGV